MVMKKRNLSERVKVIFIMSVFMIGCLKVSAQIKTVPIKKEKSGGKEFLARRQPDNYNPHKLKEIPFVENVPAPKLSVAEGKRGYMLFKRPITAIVYPGTRPKASERLRNIEGFATQREFEPLTFSIYPTRKLKNLRVRMSPLKNGDATIGPSSIDVRLETCWYNRFPKYRSKSYRKIPELLEKVTVHSSAAGECQRYWIIVHVPKNAKAGVYRGKVTVWDDGFDKAIEIPVRFRVLGFQLSKDPNKHFGIYCYDISQNNVYRSSAVKDKKKWMETAVKNDYHGMVDFGIDMIPTQYPRYDSKTGKAYFENDGISITRCLKAGMKGPIPLTYGYVIGALYRKYTGKRHMAHWKVPQLPPEAFYTELTKVTRDLEAMRKKRGWPEFIYCPLDEVDASSIDFGVKTYKAVKAAGVRIFITKHPTAADAPTYASYVDIFCSQPFCEKYEKTVNAKHEYWSYPNHNSGETKIPRVRNLGGRMTYGFGLWRSGYTTLIPWIWRWDSKAFTPFSYLANPKLSPTGNMLDENGNLIPTPYWICFREGYDDERYIYTLEKSIKERENSTNPNCRKMVAKGKKLLKQIWNSIPVLPTYKESGIWPDQEFTALRWQLATAITKLRKFPANAETTTPSVLPEIAQATKTTEKKLNLTGYRRDSIKSLNTEETKVRKLKITNSYTMDLISREIKRGNVVLRDIGDEELKGWKSVTREGTLSLSSEHAKFGEKSLKYKVKIDYKKDGGGESGDYPIGWPRLANTFKKGSLDLTKYDFLTLWVWVDSDRDEVADDFTPAYLNISSWEKGSPRFIYQTNILGDIEQREWIPINIPIKSMIPKNSSPSPYKDIQRIQIGISERKYVDNTNLTFYLDRIAFVKMKHPVIKSMISPAVILLPAKSLPVDATTVGVHGATDGQITIKLLDKENKKVTGLNLKLQPSNRAILKIAGLAPGVYTIETRINSGISIKKKTVTAIPGPFFQPKE